MLMSKSDVWISHILRGTYFILKMLVCLLKNKSGVNLLKLKSMRDNLGSL